MNVNRYTSIDTCLAVFDLKAYVLLRTIKINSSHFKVRIHTFGFYHVTGFNGLIQRLTKCCLGADISSFRDSNFQVPTAYRRLFALTLSGGTYCYMQFLLT